MDFERKMNDNLMIGTAILSTFLDKKQKDILS